jgi:hypothetical protein
MTGFQAFPDIEGRIQSVADVPTTDIQVSQSSGAETATGQLLLSGSIETFEFLLLTNAIGNQSPGRVNSRTIALARR